MNRLLAALILIAALPPAGAEETKKPNVIVIMADDMGFSDLGCYGSEIPTPNLDSLAAGGLRFTQFYNTGRCCPTRASLITGLYQHQAGIGLMNDDQGLPGYRGKLSENTATFAEVMKSAGYFTIMTGKWHVGHDAKTRPTARGFMRALNSPYGGFYFADGKKPNLFLNGDPIETNDKRLPENWYSTDLWTDYGIRFIDEARTEKKPFFFYLAHNAPHFPLQAPKEDIERFRGKYKEGWDALSAKRLARQREMGLISADWKPAPRPEEIAAWDSLDDAAKDRFDNIMATYAAVVSRLDTSIGRLVTALKERGEFDNTLIFFLSDNGGNAESGPRGRDEGDPSKGPSNWFCGESWAHLENTPFRLYKHYNHEGGISSPLIVSWPAGIKAEGEGGKGRWITTPSHLIDILPTCADVGAAKYPDTRDGHPVPPAEGRSLKPLLTGTGTLPERSLFFEHEGNAAIRKGDMKLVRKGQNGPWELYDMKADRTELDNLAPAKPELAGHLREEWRAWAKRANVLPKPDGPQKAGPAKKAAKKAAREAGKQPAGED